MFRRLNFYGTADCDLISKHPDRGEVVLPKRSLLYVIYALFLVLIAAASHKWWVLMMIPVVFFAENVIMSALVNRLSKEKRATLPQQFVAQMLIHDGEFSYLKRCVSLGHFSDTRRQMIYYLGQYNGMLEIGSYTTCLEFVILLCIAFIALLLM